MPPCLEYPLAVPLFCPIVWSTRRLCPYFAPLPGLSSGCSAPMSGLFSVCAFCSAPLAFILRLCPFNLDNYLPQVWTRKQALKGTVA